MHAKNNTVTIPKWLYESMLKDIALVQHLTHYRGIGWINAVREEMKSDKKFDQGMFKKYDLVSPFKRIHKDKRVGY